MVHYERHPPLEQALAWLTRMAMWSNLLAASKRRWIKRCGDEAVVISRHALLDVRFVHDLIHKRNQRRTARFSAEKAALRPLPATALSPCKEMRVTVSRFSTSLPWETLCI